MKLSSCTEISRQQSFLPAHIFFISRCQEKKLIAVFKLPTFSYQGQALVTLYVQFLCSDWPKFDR